MSTRSHKKSRREEDKMDKGPNYIQIISGESREKESQRDYRHRGEQANQAKLIIEKAGKNLLKYFAILATVGGLVLGGYLTDGHDKDLDKVNRLASKYEEVAGLTPHPAPEGYQDEEQIALHEQIEKVKKAHPEENTTTNPIYAKPYEDPDFKPGEIGEK